MTRNAVTKKRRLVPSHGLATAVVLWAGCAATGPAGVQPTNQDTASLSHQPGPRQTKTVASPSRTSRDLALDARRSTTRQAPPPGLGFKLTGIQKTRKNNASQSNDATVVGRVLDIRTRKPVTDAMVFYGSCGTRRTTTDQQGRYQILVPWGDVYLHVAARSHRGAQARFKAPRRGRVTRDFLLAPKPGPVPRQETLEGLVTDRVFAQGTRSEFHEIVLQLNGTRPKPLVLFDQSGCSAPLSKWVGKHVRLRGYRAMGSVGWMHRPTPGFMVESVVVIQPHGSQHP